MYKILVIEDNPDIVANIYAFFEPKGFELDNAHNGYSGLTLASNNRYDVILLDVMLPGIDGFEICNRIREQSRSQAIIMLTAKSNDEDIIHGLSLGADDYVSKPFSVAQLVLRVQAVLRRTSVDSKLSETIKLSDKAQIDCQNLSGAFNNEEVSFTKREIDLLRYLQANAERPVSRDELLHKVWGYADDLSLETRTVDIHIAKLRRKIEADSSTPQYLVTVRGAGYRLLSAD